MPGLRFFRGEQEMMWFPLPEGLGPEGLGPEGQISIGRSPSNDISLPDKAISRQHVLIEFRNGRYWVIDKSLNGTLLNKRSVGRHELKPGDELAIGAWQILFSEEGFSEPETVALKSSLPQTWCGMVGESEVLRKVFSLIERVAPGNLSILILGETGSGKELVARAIHENSLCARGPFVVLNCGAISPQLIESELFGHEKGAFTGALEKREGAFEQASGGTLFLDEVGELPLELQPKLLRVLEGQPFRRVGGKADVRADVRVLAATHRDLEAKVREGKFREDLFFRLNGIPLAIPPLRERKEDIPRLVEFFLKTFDHEGRRSFSAEALNLLCAHPWKGNIRELKNVVARLLLLVSADVVGPGDLNFLSPPSTAAATGNSLREREKNVIATALREHRWNKKEVAAKLGIAKSTLFQKIKDYGIREN